MGADEFLEFCLARDVLRFGEFTLKSGRKSPYFFNAGLFNTGSAIAELGKHYATAIVQSGVEFDVLFGPAYKGIPLVTATAAALATEHGRDVAWCYNRKEAKDHGEGGVVVGAPLKGRVLIVDDVITAGTAVREAVGIIEVSGAKLASVVVSLDRQERGQSDSGASAIQEVEKEFGISVIAIATLTELVKLLEKKGVTETLRKVQTYREQYGIGSV